MLFSDDEEERKNAFYGKGLVGATGIVPLSDVVELHNLGAAAGYWELLADEESTAGWLMGLREYKSIDDIKEENRQESLETLKIYCESLNIEC